MIALNRKVVAPFARRSGSAVALFVFCILTPMLGGCGRTGLPRAPDESRSFAWEEVNAKIVGRCIAFTGAFSGAYQYVDGIRLEIDTLSGPEDCPGCPFVPDEVTELSPRDAGFNAKSGSVAFSYCPQPATAYRWRLAGISAYNRLPHATMIDRLLVVNP